MAMTTKVVGAAEADMARQFDYADGYSYSLDSMWRAAGSPEGRDPGTWIDLALPLIHGTAQYFKALDGLKKNQGGVLHSCTPGTSDPILFVAVGYGADDRDPENPVRPGDRVATPIVAEVYASFLDGLAHDEDEQRRLRESAGRQVA
jgi:hypothetical protein